MAALVRIDKGIMRIDVVGMVVAGFNLTQVSTCRTKQFNILKPIDQDERVKRFMGESYCNSDLSGREKEDRLTELHDLLEDLQNNGFIRSTFTL